MFHLLYKTVNLFTNEYYIGIHSTSNLFDGYIGSGVKLWLSINKHGISHFDTLWLEFFDSREEAFAREAEIVTQKLIDSDSQCINLIPGGGLAPIPSFELQSRRGKAGIQTQRILRESDSSWLESTKLAQSKSQLKSYENGREARGASGEFLTEMCIRAQRPKARAKRIATMSANGHAQGKKNSQFGTCWVSNSVHTVKIKLELLDEYISKGYTRGRKLV